MPYIPQEDRDRIERLNDPQTPGELNYVITTLCLLPEPINTRKDKIVAAVEEYLATKGQGRANYALYNEIIGAIECARLEHERRTMTTRGTVDDLLKYARDSFYRIRVAPYENEKIIANGDIYA